MERTPPLLVTLAALAAALPGCGTDVPQAGPQVTVAVWDDGAGCYARCEGTPRLDAAVAAAAGQACPDAEGAEGRACVLREGTDRLRLIADHGGLIVSSCADVPLPTLTQILDDDRGQQTLGGLSPGCVDRQHYFAQKTLIVPVTSSRTARYRVASSTTYFTDTPSFDLVRPTLGLAVARCLDAEGQPLADCSLVAGVDRTLVTITAPSGLADTTAILRWTVGNSASQSQSVTLSPRGNTEKAGSFELPAPDAPGQTLTITAQIGDLEPVSQSVALIAPDPLQIQVTKLGAPLDFTAPPPMITAGDPTAECRTLTVGVLAPRGAPGDVVTLTTSQGTLDGSDSLMAPLHAAQAGPGRTATATLKLPASPSSPLLQLLASSGTALTTSRELQLLPVLPTAAQIVAAKKTITVDASGSAAALVTGFALAPGGAGFLEGTRVSVVVKATPSGATSLPCGAPSTAADLGCDATTPGQLPGGCLLGPPSVQLGADGALAIPLAAGICFAGTVTVDVYAATYASSEVCLGDRQVTAGPVRLTAGPVLTLTYGP